MSRWLPNWWFFGERFRDDGTARDLTRAEEIEADAIAVSLDRQAKQAMANWPNRTRQWNVGSEDGCWIKCRPFDGGAANPILQLSHRCATTLPDGLWIHFRDRTAADVIAIEACSTKCNAEVKAHRYEHLREVRINARWFLEEMRVQGGGYRPIYSAIPSLGGEDESSIRAMDTLVVRIERLALGIALPDELYDWGVKHHPFPSRATILKFSDLNDHQCTRIRSIWQ